MRNSVLPVMTVLTIVAGAVGLQLGESAISQIDPIYFQGGNLPPRDVTKDPRPASASAFSQASGWAEGYMARAADCGPGCTPLTPATAPARAAPLYTYSDATIAPRWQYAEDVASGDELRIERSLESSQVQRYLHYPVSADQAEIRAGLDGETAEAGEPARAEGPTGL
jgi:hypothetical protein